MIVSSFTRNSSEEALALKNTSEENKIKKNEEKKENDDTSQENDKGEKENKSNGEEKADNDEEEEGGGSGDSGGNDDGGGGGGDEDDGEEKKQNLSNERLCCSCKKWSGKAKKKGKNRTRIRKLPSQFQSLSSIQKEMIRNEFNLKSFLNENNENTELVKSKDSNETHDIVRATTTTTDAVKLRLCFECFKKMVTRLQELILVQCGENNENGNAQLNRDLFKSKFLF